MYPLTSTLQDGEQADMASIVVPCSLSESLSVQLCVLLPMISNLLTSHVPIRLKDTFCSIASLKQHGEDASEERMDDLSKWHNEFIYLAITSSDSSQVYYKIGNGIVKPQM